MPEKSEKYFKEFLSNITEALKKLKFHSEITKEKFRMLQAIATKSSKSTKDIKTKGKEISGYLEGAISPNYEITLKILEKFDDLNKKGIITKKGFDQKKKEMLRRI